MEENNSIKKILEDQSFLDLVNIEQKLGDIKERARKAAYSNQARNTVKKLQDQGIDIDMAKDYALAFKSKINEIEKKKTLPVIIITENKKVKEKKVNPESIDFDIKTYLKTNEIEKIEEKDFFYYYDPKNKVFNKKASRFLNKKVYGKIVILAKENKKIVV